MLYNQHYGVLFAVGKRVYRRAVTLTILPPRSSDPIPSPAVSLAQPWLFFRDLQSRTAAVQGPPNHRSVLLPPTREEKKQGYRHPTRQSFQPAEDMPSSIDDQQIAGVGNRTMAEGVVPEAIKLPVGIPIPVGMPIQVGTPIRVNTAMHMEIPINVGIHVVVETPPSLRAATGEQGRTIARLLSPPTMRTFTDKAGQISIRQVW